MGLSQSMDPHAVIDLLADNGLLEAEDARRLSAIADLESSDIFEALEAVGCGSRVEVLRSIAELKEMEFLDLRSAAMPPQLLQELPSDLMRIYKCFPVFVSVDLCKVCMVDPLDGAACSELSRLIAKPVHPVVADPDLVEATLEHALGNSPDFPSPLGDPPTAPVIASLGTSHPPHAAPPPDGNREPRWVWVFSLLAVAVVAVAALYLGQKRSSAATLQLMADLDAHKRDSGFSTLSSEKEIREIELELRKLRELLEKNEVDAISLEQLEAGVQRLEGKIESIEDISNRSTPTQETGIDANGR